MQKKGDKDKILSKVKNRKAFFQEREEQREHEREREERKMLELNLFRQCQ